VLIIQLDSEHRSRQNRNNLPFQRYALFSAHFATLNAKTHLNPGSELISRTRGLNIENL
jgi:hypothetical protein